MASLDEDFFDKLVDDEFSGEESPTASKGLARDSLNSTHGDVGTSVDESGDVGLVAGGRGKEEDDTFLSSDAQKVNHLPSVTSVTQALSVQQSSMMCGDSCGNGEVFTLAGTYASPCDGKSDEKKGTGVKRVQWSSFDAGSEQNSSGGVAFHSDFFAQNNFGGSSVPLPKENAGLGFMEDGGEKFSTNTVSSELYETNHDSVDQNADVNDPKYWENLYPGWKYNAHTGQWYQLDTCEATVSSHYSISGATVEKIHENIQDKPQVFADSNLGNSGSVSPQHAGQSILEDIPEGTNLTNVSDWNMVSQLNAVYPPNMVFDPLYPGWYYDTNDMQWHSLESYSQTIRTALDEVQYQTLQDMNTSGGFSEQNHLYKDTATTEQSFIQDLGTQCFSGEWKASASNYSKENVWQPARNQEQFHGGFPAMLQPGESLSSKTYGGHSNDPHTNQERFEPSINHNSGNRTNVVRSQNFVPGQSMYPFNQTKMDKYLQSSLSSSHYGDKNALNFPQQSFRGPESSFSQLSNTREGRSSVGRPAHALITFGFGGQLIVMKNDSSFGMMLDSGMQGTTVAAISILKLSDVVRDKYNASNIDKGSAFSYFSSLFEQVLPGPLGGSTAMKDVNKWLDERITKLDSSVSYQSAKLLKLLLSLLKLSCLHYGKLRSPFGSNPSAEGTDGPELAVTNLFASCKRNSNTFGNSSAISHCMKNIPSEGQIRATAIDVQNLLITGRRKEALQHAQEGHLWGPALVLAAQLGDQFYVDTVKKMVQSQFISGSPLRTLCLLIAGKPADVFSDNGSTANASGEFVTQAAQVPGNCILSSWEENLAIITSNRTKDDELVIIHLGDCLWKEKGEVAAAHTCYLVAEANFELYSDSARLCLIGADHWKYPRTYASPDAIQRTEIYEYSKVLGNSQFILRPFQPYKLLYAYMLAEVGKVSDSMRYCQASLKLLKNSGRAPEIEMLKTLLLSLEERLRTHQQGGYDKDLAPTKLVGKLFTSIDRSIHRMMGTSSDSLPPIPQSSIGDKETLNTAPKVTNSRSTMATSSLTNSQSTMAMSSLAPAASVEAMSAWKGTGHGGRKIGHHRSISEPGFGSTISQDEVSEGLSNESMSGTSRFGSFGFGSSILQKTIGWVSRSHRQAKLGESNKFYYDEKLKKWVEEGATPPTEEPALPPPPKAATFQNGMPGYSMNNAFKHESLGQSEMTEAKLSSLPEHKSTIPPISSSQNQFSACARGGVRSRYVDTFNKGSAVSTPSFQSTAVPSIKSIVGSTFFVPTIPVTLDEQGTVFDGDNNQGASINREVTTSMRNDTFSSPASPSMLRKQLPGIDNLSPHGHNSVVASSMGSNKTPIKSRPGSWSGTYPDVTTSTLSTEKKPLNTRRRSLSNDHNTLTSFTPVSLGELMSESLLQHNSGSLGDLHDIQL